MARLEWDKSGEKTYQTGCDRGVLYVVDTDGAYTNGVAWNGITAATESPSGAEVTSNYADNIKYMNLVSAEEFGGTIEAYTFPQEFGVCDGTAEPVPGMSVGQQGRKSFGFSFRTLLGNDTQGTDHGYLLHIWYGCLAAPSERAYATVNDSPEAITFSWEVSTTPVSFEGYKPTASVIIDSTKVNKAQMTTLENILYGTESNEARLPLPAEIVTLLSAGSAG